jgi:nitrogenase molybdenum-iron protein alpha/beta subunit
MVRPLTELNVNPCKMCMPMGASTALMGIAGCMVILHGSQGCATYIRRHMATHYNEPVDIASSSLTEQGTVFGGEENLIKGLRNLITLYDPEVIGIATTCLAETIGEDAAAIAGKFLFENPGVKAKLVTVSSPGYGGTQNEGYFAALRAVVEQTARPHAPTGKIAVFTPHISPADTRWLKAFLASCGLAVTLLPDISDNLDGATSAKYERLKRGGARLCDIEALGGAASAVELSTTVPDALSPGSYLAEAFGVPLTRLPLPVGLRGFDAMTRAVERLGGKLPAAVETERGRYLDAMVDGHKYAGAARAAIFGEPDFIRAVSSLCCENGVVPSVVANGGVDPDLRRDVYGEAAVCAGNVFAPEPMILDDADFTDIESACTAQGVNVMLGSSDGRRAAARLGVELIRCAFPIHDRVGGQRVRTLGLEGSLALLDRVCNATLRRTERGRTAAENRRI